MRELNCVSLVEAAYSRGRCKNESSVQKNHRRQYITEAAVAFV